MSTRKSSNEPGFIRPAIIFGVVLLGSVGVGLLALSDRAKDDAKQQARAQAMERARAAAARPAPAPAAAPAPEIEATEPETTAPAVAAPPAEPLPAPTYAEAEAAYLARDWTQAADLFTRYCEDRPTNPWGHYMRGLSLRWTGDVDGSEAAFLACLEIDPDHVKSLVNLARVRLDAERGVEAEEAARRAVEAAAESVDAHRVLARALHTQGRRLEALETYDAALALDPADAWSLNNRGLLLIEEERFEEAANALLAATTADGSQATFHNNLGVALERLGRTADARDAYLAAVERDDSYEKARVSLARVEPLVPNETAEVYAETDEAPTSPAADEGETVAVLNAEAPEFGPAEEPR